MRTLAWQIIEDAAVAAGLASDRVIDKPKKRSAALHEKPRLELEDLGDTLIREPRLIAKFLAADERYIIHRKKIYVRQTMVRAAFVAETEAETEEFLAAFLLALPHKTADEDNNLLLVVGEKAERKGFETRLVEPLPEKEAAIWIKFTGGLYQDLEIPLIREVNLVDGISITRTDIG